MKNWLGNVFGKRDPAAPSHPLTGSNTEINALFHSFVEPYIFRMFHLDDNRKTLLCELVLIPLPLAPDDQKILLPIFIRRISRHCEDAALQRALLAGR
jgi:hypothetical protein